MKQIVDKLNKIAKKIDENVEIPQTDLIIDSLDAITKAYGGTPNDSNLIVDKLEDIYNNIGAAPSGNIEITENTAEGVPLDIAQYATATVNVAGGGDTPVCCTVTIVDSENTGNSVAFDEPAVLNTDYQFVVLVTNYPTTLYAFYKDVEGDNDIVNLSRWQPTTNYSAGNFTNLVNCEVTTETEDGVFWHIEVLDKTLPSSITIDVKAFKDDSQ